MASFLDTLPATIGAAFFSTFKAASLLRDVPGTITDPADPPPPTTTVFACRALVETYAERYRLDGTVKANDRRLMILASTLATTPKPADRVTVAGATYTISEVATDPATAVWACKASV